MRPSLLAILLLGACAAAELPQPQPVRPVAPGTTEPLRFTDLSTGMMRRNMETGRYVWNIDCAPPYGRVFWTSGEGFRRYSTFRERFAEVFADAGFDVVGTAFDGDSRNERARYTITGELREVRLELCRRIHWLFNTNKGISGAGTVKIDWTVYAPDEQRVVYRTATTGHAALDDSIPDGDVLLMEDGFSDAAATLAADPGFRAAVALGGPLPVQPPAMGGASAAPVPLWQAQPPARRTLTAAPPLRGTPADAVVRVGSGRGVVVGALDGGTAILAPAMPDGSVSVRAGRVALDGTVERRGAGLVLVRVPARLEGLPLRRTPPAVSETVRTPSATGIVAGLTGGIQADLDGAAPEPGEPLLDASGALIGLAVGRGAAGLAAFVPVAEALEALGLDVGATKPSLDGRGRPPT